VIGPVSGGPPIDIGRTPYPHFALWATRDEILYNARLPVSLWSISANGGQPKEIGIRSVAGTERIALHCALPGGDLLISSTGASASYLEVLSRKTGERRRLMRGGTSYVARYVSTGHLLYGDGDSLWGCPERC
jgi:hypothetical protein